MQFTQRRRLGKKNKNYDNNAVSQSMNCRMMSDKDFCSVSKILSCFGVHFSCLYEGCKTFKRFNLHCQGLGSQDWPHRNGVFEILHEITRI